MISRVQAGACLAALLLSVTLPGVAGAQLLGSMSTASVEEVGASKVGGYVGVTNDFVSLAGQYRFGVASSFDLGAKAAYVDFSSPLGNSLALNADAKIQILDIFLQDPVDLSLGPEVTYFRVNGVTNWYFGGFVLVSREYARNNGRPLTPYARVGLRMHRIETDAGDEDDFDTGIAAGAEYGLSGYTTLFGEIVIEDAGTGLYAGVQYQLP